MVTFSKKIEIQEFAEVIWSVMIDVERWNEWTTTITRIKKLNQGSLSKGTRLLVEQPKLPQAIWSVCEIEDGKSFTMAKGNLFLRVEAGHKLETIRNGTLVTLSLVFSGLFAKWVAKKYRLLMEEYLAIEAAGLKTESEAGITLMLKHSL